MKNANRKAIIIVLLLGGIFAVALAVSGNDAEKRKELLQSATIEILRGEDKKNIVQEDIKKLEIREFQAALDTSVSDRSEHSYTGVELRHLLKEYLESTVESSYVVISGVDGFSVAYSISEVLEQDNIFLVFMEDGKYLGDRDIGGRGPYETIVVSDMFSNRRCKWIVRIEVIE